MSFVQGIGRSHGTKDVVIVHGAGTDSETRQTVTAAIQSGKGFFEVDTRIYEGDTVEVPDPRGGTDRRLVRDVKVNDFGSANMRHIAVEFGKAQVPRQPPIRRLALERLHQAVIVAASDHFADGHYESAIGEAFKSIDIRVREITGIQKSGSQLMGDAFAPKAPIIDVALQSGQSGQDEREGFLSLFRGAMIGIRNPRAHELHEPMDAEAALEYLALASLLHRRLDVAIIRSRGA